MPYMLFLTERHLIQILHQMQKYSERHLIQIFHSMKK